MEWVLWIISLIIDLALLGSTAHQFGCLLDLAEDKLNPYDASSSINALVIPHMLVHGIWCGLFLLTRNWFMFLFTLPITIYNAMLYSEGRHLIDVTEIFRSVKAETKSRLVRLVFYIIMLVIVVIGFGLAVWNDLRDDDEERESLYGLF